MLFIKKDFKENLHEFINKIVKGLNDIDIEKNYLLSSYVYKEKVPNKFTLPKRRLDFGQSEEDSKENFNILNAMSQLNSMIVNDEFPALNKEKDSTTKKKENSNQNLKSILKRKKIKQGIFRDGDWDCPRCRNINFAFRKQCNKCGLPKQKGDQQNEIVAGKLFSFLSSSC